MIALGGFAGFPADADVITTVDLTPEETLALYGVSIPAVYKSGDTWHNCTFSYGGVVYPDSIWYDFRGSYPAGYSSWSDYATNAIDNRTYLAYICSFNDASPDGASEFQFVLSPSLDISGIAYYRQNFLLLKRITRALILRLLPVFVQVWFLILQPLLSLRLSVAGTVTVMVM